MRRSRLHIWILLGMVLGAGWGTALNRVHFETFEEEARAEVLGPAWTAPEAMARQKQVQGAIDARFEATFFGGAAYGLAALFLALLKMVVIPLVLFSLVCGVVGLKDFGRLGKIGLKTGAWYLTTSLLAILTGLLLVNLLGPGRGLTLPLPGGEAAPVTEGAGFWKMIVEMVPANVVQAMAEFDLLSVIVFAIFFGIFLLKLPEEKRAPVERFFEGAFAVMLEMTSFIIKLAPLGIAALIARLVASTGPSVFVDLMGYVGTVGLALALHAFVTLPSLIWLATRRNPFRVMQAMSPALLTAFSTASSSGTLPVTMERLERGVGVSNKVSSFVLPLGATVNMDGTALYECVATLFVAQVFATAHPEFALGFGAQLTIVTLALLVSIGAAGIPHAGLVMMVIIFEAVGLPLELTALLWAVDRPLDMMRTAVNVWSDSSGATVVAHVEGEIGTPELHGGPSRA
ncbi:MAG: dicarboxylate/amino acid:cation symporter [Deltaproteobacteria bacterium]|nr:dicarboxylate/amino acid:cation symporter [Deltaproteobacteria bacterium]